MIRILCQILGIFFCFIGLIGLLTPIPFGIIFMTIGLLFLIPTTPAVVRLVKSARSRSRHVDSVMSAATRRAPMPYRRILRQTEIDF